MSEFKAPLRWENCWAHLDEVEDDKLAGISCPDAPGSSRAISKRDTESTGVSTDERPKEGRKPWRCSNTDAKHAKRKRS